MIVPVPPVSRAVADPVLPPEHVILVLDEMEGVPTVLAMVAVMVCTQPPASVMVQVYVPGERPEAVAPLPPEGDQEYV